MRKADRFLTCQLRTEPGSPGSVCFVCGRRPQERILFCNTKHADKELQTKAKKMGAISLYASCTSEKLRLGKKQIQFYLISASEDENLCHAESLIRRYRDGGQETARILRDTLTERGYRVFFDVESLRSGAFNEKLYAVIESCKDFVLVLSPNALDRCSDPNDWVRQEITHAFRNGKNIIPILLRGFEFPEELPEALKDLPYQNGLTANVEYYDAFVNKLETFLHSQKKRWSPKLLLIPAAAAILAVCLFIASIPGKYPGTPAQIDLTERVVASVGYNLSTLNSLAVTHQEMLQAAEACLITGETDVCSDRFAVCANGFAEAALSAGEPDADLLDLMRESPFSSEELKAMHEMVATFHQECLDTMAYMEFLVSEECMLSDSEKLKTVEEHLESFWKEMLSLSGRLTDDVGVLWEKLTYLLDLELYEEAEECILLYQHGMTNSDRYMPGLVLYMQLKQEGMLDHGIMVMEYYKDDGINEQLMIGDIIYQFNGAPCRTVDEYLAAKNALTSDAYTVKLLRMDENNKAQVLELTIPADSPRVYLNDLLPPAED